MYIKYNLTSYYLKKIIVFLFLIIIFFTNFTLSSCMFFSRNFESVFLIYLDGANNLDDFAVKDLNEIFNARLNKNNNSIILILIDRIITEDHDYEDWFDTRLFEIKYKNDNQEITELDCDKLGLTTLYIDEDLDMGNSNTIKNFCKFAKDNYPSNHYYLDIWNHGGGWRYSNKEICSDDESESIMYMIDLRNALKETDIHFDAIYLDACYMATIEVAVNFIDLTDYILFSQKPIPADGMPYDNLIPFLFSDEDIEKRLTNICESFVKFYKDNNNNDISISCLKIDKQNALDSFLRIFVDETNKIDYQNLRQLRESAIEFSETTVDFSVFTGCNINIKNQLPSLILYKYPETLSGISIYFPKYLIYDQYYFDYNNKNVYMCEKYNGYIEFLKKYNHTGIENKDTYEPNGIKSKAYLVNPGSSLISYIWFEQDIDFYKLSYIPQIFLKLTLCPPKGFDYDLKIYYYKNGNLSILQSANNGDKTEVIEIDSDTLNGIEELYIAVFGADQVYSQISSYTLIIE